MWNTSVKFPKKIEIVQDSSGFQSHRETYTESIPAARQDATRSDETLALSRGYTVSKVFSVMTGCYNDYAYLIDEQDGKVYDIKRSFVADKSNMVELTCEVRSDGKI